MLHVSHSPVSVWDSGHPAIRTSYQDHIALRLSLFPSPSAVQTHFWRAIGDICTPNSMLSPKPKANNKQWKPCHLSLCCCPSTRKGQAAAVARGAAGFVSQPPLPGAHPQQRFAAQLESQVDTSPSARLDATHGRCTMTAPGETLKRAMSKKGWAKDPRHHGFTETELKSCDGWHLGPLRVEC